MTILRRVVLLLGAGLLTVGMASAHEHAVAAAASAPVASVNGGSVYGAAMPDGDAVAIAAVAAQPQAHTGSAKAFRGRITEVCQKQGCWMVLEDQGHFARVFMHEHGFTVPREARSEAIVYGSLSVKDLSPKEIAHLAGEGSKPAERELQIDALSVWIAGR